MSSRKFTRPSCRGSRLGHGPTSQVRSNGEPPTRTSRVAYARVRPSSESPQRRGIFVGHGAKRSSSSTTDVSPLSTIERPPPAAPAPISCERRLTCSSERAMPRRSTLRSCAGTTAYRRPATTRGRACRHPGRTLVARSEIWWVEHPDAGRRPLSRSHTPGGDPGAERASRRAGDANHSSNPHHPDHSPISRANERGISGARARFRMQLDHERAKRSSTRERFARNARFGPLNLDQDEPRRPLLPWC